MVGLGLSMTYYGILQGFAASHPFSLTRSTAAWAQDVSGNLYEFPVNAPRITNAGLTITGAAVRQHGEFPANGSSSSSTKTDLPVEGLFSPARVASAGAEWHRWQTDTFSAVNGTTYHWRVRIREGTSGRAKIEWRDSHAATSSVVVGAFGSLSVTGSAAGAIAISSDILLPSGDRELVGTLTSNADSPTVSLGVGPSSTTVGEYVDVIGGQVTDAYSDWIMGGTGTVTQAADRCQLDLTGVDMSDGFMIRMDGTLLAPVSTTSWGRFYQADNGANENRIATVVGRNDGGFNSSKVSTEALADSAPQGSSLGVVVTPPEAFSIAAGHGTDYIQLVQDGVTYPADASATYVTPTQIYLGSTRGTTDFLPLRLTRVTLVPGTPSTAALEALAS